jgi:hypothetical protein
MQNAPFPGDDDLELWQMTSHQVARMLLSKPDLPLKYLGQIDGVKQWLPASMAEDHYAGRIELASRVVPKGFKDASDEWQQ